jgi:hypothetical protein
MNSALVVARLLRILLAEKGGLSRDIYFRRNVLWDVVLRLISHGYTHESAIDHIYNHYGKQKSVTQILMCIRKEKKEIDASRSRNRNPLMMEQFV